MTTNANRQEPAMTTTSYTSALAPGRVVVDPATGDRLIGVHRTDLRCGKSYTR